MGEKARGPSGTDRLGSDRRVGRLSGQEHVVEDESRSAHEIRIRKTDASIDDREREEHERDQTEQDERTAARCRRAERGGARSRSRPWHPSQTERRSKSYPRGNRRISRTRVLSCGTMSCSHRSPDDAPRTGKSEDQGLASASGERAEEHSREDRPPSSACTRSRSSNPEKRRSHADARTARASGAVSESGPKASLATARGSPVPSADEQHVRRRLARAQWERTRSSLSASRGTTVRPRTR